MSERDQSPATPQWSGQPPVDWRADTTPGITQQPAGGTYSGAGASAVGAGTAAGGPGWSGEHAGPYAGRPAGDHPGRHAGPGEHPGSGAALTAPQYSTSPVTVRRPDVLAALLLVLAGIAAAISLLLEWLRGSSDTGWDLVDRGLEVLSRDFGVFVDRGFWEPVAIVLGGGVLLVLGLLVLVPARSHRTLGVLALLVSLLAAAAVVVLANDLDWDVQEFGIGLWVAVAVAGLGLLGAFKAMLTGPRLR
ncbi:hypothetical protein [Blastococcus sp. SYSU D00695]